MLLLNSDKPHVHCRVAVPSTDRRVHPSGLASSCEPSSQHYTDFLWWFADPPGSKDLPTDIPADARTRCWLDIQQPQPNSCVVCALLLPCLTALLPAHSSSTPSPADLPTAIDSLDCSHASASSEDPRLLSRPLFLSQSSGAWLLCCFGPFQ
jgi:hypothetical protein